MQQQNIIFETNPIEDEFTEYVKRNYDVSYASHGKTEIPMLDVSELSKRDWKIGCIVGNSGCGKSTVLSRIGSLQQPNFDPNKPIVSQICEEPKQAVKILQSVGLSSIPTYLHKINELSNGERARVEMAWNIAHPQNGLVLIDEFTSVVNRQCAKSLAFALQRYIRKSELKLIVASCHFDIIEEGWLKPDWIYDMNQMVGDECMFFWNNYTYKDNLNRVIISKTENVNDRH